MSQVNRPVPECVISFVSAGTYRKLASVLCIHLPHRRCSMAAPFFLIEWQFIVLFKIWIHKIFFYIFLHIFIIFLYCLIDFPFSFFLPIALYNFEAAMNIISFSSKHSDLFIMNLSTSVSAASYSFVLIYAYTPEVAATTFPGSFCIHFLQNSTDSFVLPSSRSTVAFLI